MNSSTPTSRTHGLVCRSMSSDVGEIDAADVSPPRYPSMAGEGDWLCDCACDGAYEGACDDPTPTTGLPANNPFTCPAAVHSVNPGPKTRLPPASNPVRASPCS